MGWLDKGTFALDRDVAASRRLSHPAQAPSDLPCLQLGARRGRRGGGASLPRLSRTFNVTRLLPPRFLAHSQLLIAPGLTGMGPVTWLFSQPSTVTRGCFVFGTAIKANLAVRHLILAFKHPCFISFPGLPPFVIPSNMPSGNPITTLKDKGPCYLEFAACPLNRSQWIKYKRAIRSVENATFRWICFHLGIFSILAQPCK